MSGKPFNGRRDPEHRRPKTWWRDDDVEAARSDVLDRVAAAHDAYEARDRDPTARHFGDPPPGRSALDRRRGGEA